MRDLRASGKMASCGRGAGGGHRSVSVGVGGRNNERGDTRSRDAEATRWRSTPGRFREWREANAANGRRVRAHHFARSLRDVSVRGEECRRVVTGASKGGAEEAAFCEADAF